MLQVLTRLLFSSCPVLYWFCAHLISDNTPAEPHYNKYDVSTSQGPSADLQNTLHKNKCSKINPVVEQIVNFRKEKLQTRLVILYFLSYYVVGTTLFSNFLPWT